MSGSPYDKQLKKCIWALGLMGLKPLKYFRGKTKTVTKNLWVQKKTTTVLLWGKVHSRVSYSEHTETLFKQRYASNAHFTGTYYTLCVCVKFTYLLLHLATFSLVSDSPIRRVLCMGKDQTSGKQNDRVFFIPDDAV